LWCERVFFWHTAIYLIVLPIFFRSFA